MKMRLLKAMSLGLAILISGTSGYAADYPIRVSVEVVGSSLGERHIRDSLKSIKDVEIVRKDSEVHLTVIILESKSATGHTLGFSAAFRVGSLSSMKGSKCL